MTERLTQTAEELRRIDRLRASFAAPGDPAPVATGAGEIRGRTTAAAADAPLGDQSWCGKRKAPNPGGGVGREKRVMRMVPGGKPAPQAMSFG